MHRLQNLSILNEFVLSWNNKAFPCSWEYSSTPSTSFPWSRSSYTQQSVCLGQRVWTHLVNHQNVIVERKPAVASGHGFWGKKLKMCRKMERLNKDMGTKYFCEQPVGSVFCVCVWLVLTSMMRPQNTRTDIHMHAFMDSALHCSRMHDSQGLC